MDKTETSDRPKKSDKKSLTEYVPFQSEELKDSSLISEVLLESVRTGDPESFREVLTAHLLTVNKTNFSRQTGLSRRTLYSLIDPNKKFNPEFSTISALIQGLST